MTLLKWTMNTAKATQDYINGIENPKSPWAKATCEAGDTYKAGVDAAHKEDLFVNGVKKTSQSGYLTKTLLKGPTRFAQGVGDAGDAFAEGYKPYHTHFPSILMPAKFPKGDPRNIDRVAAVSAAMGMVKMNMAGTGKVTCPDS
jgi:hypothetical protein